MNHEKFIHEISSPMGVPTRSTMNHENYCLEEAEKCFRPQKFGAIRYLKFGTDDCPLYRGSSGLSTIQWSMLHSDEVSMFSMQETDIGCLIYRVCVIVLTL